MRRFILLIAGIVVTLISMQFFHAPFIWIFFSWFTVFLASSKFSATSFSKMLFFYLCFVPLALGLFESYLWISKKPGVWDNFTKDASIRMHEILGYAPRKNSSTAHRRYFRNELLFNVAYTIDADGLRVSPPWNSSESLGSILFFGCSFTFGTGVNDAETMPYQVGTKLRGKYRIFNFGFRGYGPHQMLSAIEHGMVERCVAKNKPKYAIYQALLGHIGRAAGLGFWDVSGPKYTLNKDGVVHYSGHFDKRLLSLLSKSLIFKKILVKKISQLHFNNDQVDLFIGIVSACKKMMETRYPGCEFHVIIWDNSKHQNNRDVLEKLKGKGIRAHRVSDIFKTSHVSGRQSELRISPHDPHPTRLAYEKIADYVVKRIVKIE
jgi:hypothetical protein